MRVYKRANELLWIGNLPEYRQNQKISLDLAKEKFTNIKPGDQLVMDLEVRDPAKQALTSLIKVENLSQHLSQSLLRMTHR